jgi:hypothetical protein
MTDLLHVENMRVSQARIHEGIALWFVVTANGAIVSQGYPYRVEAEIALSVIRSRAREEAEGVA